MTSRYLKLKLLDFGPASLPWWYSVPVLNIFCFSRRRGTPSSGGHWYKSGGKTVKKADKTQTRQEFSEVGAVVARPLPSLVACHFHFERSDDWPVKLWRVDQGVCRASHQDVHVNFSEVCQFRHVHLPHLRKTIPHYELEFLSRGKFQMKHRRVFTRIFKRGWQRRLRYTVARFTELQVRLVRNPLKTHHKQVAFLAGRLDDPFQTLNHDQTVLHSERSREYPNNASVLCLFYHVVSLHQQLVHIHGLKFSSSTFSIVQAKSAPAQIHHPMYQLKIVVPNKHHGVFFQGHFLWKFKYPSQFLNAKYICFSLCPHIGWFFIILFSQ